jgi:hypothetical protein
MAGFWHRNQEAEPRGLGVHGLSAIGMAEGVSERWVGRKADTLDLLKHASSKLPFRRVPADQP